ncbi:MAG: phosphomannomutase/phosphoglucomutase [Campylobacteraceae bacterium]|jgi:phosphomannomutase/phosphoglucomutase|nr:phosphomannomutase/phosphoglucomutase [Campylobacteraceae bacterium]
MRHIFREYDIRGIFEKDLDEKSVKAIGFFLGKKILETGLTVGVGYDARTHSKKLFSWLVAGLTFADVKVKNMGLVPTPCNYFAGFFDDENRVDATIMITGSHNPPEYNGFKITINRLPFFGADIEKLGLEVAHEYEKLKIWGDMTCEKINTKDEYINFLVQHFKHLKNLKTKIVIDCGNGAAGVVVEKLAEQLNLNAKILFAEPDGTFPNHHPDPTEEKNLKDIKKELSTKEYNIGFAFDGDADRIAVLTQKNSFKGDELVIFYSKMLKNPQILGEVKCSQVMYDEINKRGHAYMYKTGHSNLKMKMRETKIDIAAEVSGHIFFNDRYFGYDDAIYAMLRTLELLQEGIDLDEELSRLPKMYSTDELKIQTKESEKFHIIDKLKLLLQNPPQDFPKIKDIITIDGVRVIFEDGWGLLRASNTTPVLVARFEAKSKEKMQEYQNAMQKAVTKIMESGS